jgi:hypothetical protein
MGSVVVGVIGTLLGVLIGGAIQQIQTSRARKWQREDSLSNTKRAVYAEYLRAIGASFAQAMSGHRSRSEDANLLAATAEIEVLCGKEVSRLWIGLHGGQVQAVNNPARARAAGCGDDRSYARVAYGVALDQITARVAEVLAACRSRLESTTGRSVLPTLNGQISGYQ